MEVLGHFRVSAAPPSPRSNQWICISRRCRPQSQVFSPNVLNLLQFLSTVWFVCSGNTPRPAVQECQTKPADAEGGCIERWRNLPQDIPPLLPNSITTGYGSFGTPAPFMTAISWRHHVPPVRLEWGEWRYAGWRLSGVCSCFFVCTLEEYFSLHNFVLNMWWVALLIIKQNIKTR